MIWKFDIVPSGTWTIIRMRTTSPTVTLAAMPSPVVVSESGVVVSTDVSTICSSTVGAAKPIEAASLRAVVRKLVDPSALAKLVTSAFVDCAAEPTGTLLDKRAS